MSSRTSSFSSKARRRSSLSDSEKFGKRHSSFDVASTLAFAGGLTVLPQARRLSRERLSTIVSQDGEDRALAQLARAKLPSSADATDAAVDLVVTQEDENAVSKHAPSNSRAQLHPSTRQHTTYSRQPSLAASSPLLGPHGFYTPPALLRPASSYRSLRAYFIERQKYVVNNLHLLPAAPDGGWGWVVVVAAFVTTAIVEGICYSFAPLLIHLTSEAPDMMLQILFMGATLIAAYLLICPVAMALVNAFGCRNILFAGSLISTVGFLIPYYLYAFSSGAPPPLAHQAKFLNDSAELPQNEYPPPPSPVDYNLLILSYGGLAGVGFGLMYVSALVAVSQYFELNRALAMGIALCGSGLGTLILPPILSVILDGLGFDGAVAMLAGLTLNCLPAALLLRPLRPLTAPRSHPRKKNALDRVREIQRGGHSTCSESDQSLVGATDACAATRELRLQQLAAESANESRVELVSNGNQDEGKKDAINEITDTKVTLVGESNGPLTINTEDPGDPDPQDSITRLKAQLAVVLPPPAILAAARSEKSLTSSSPNRAQTRQQQLQAMNRRFQVVTGSHQPLSLIGPGRRHTAVTMADFSRPFYRIDVLYGRSITHLPRCKSEANIADYRAAAFQVPEDNYSPNNSQMSPTRCWQSDSDQKRNKTSIGRSLLRLVPKPLLHPLECLVRDSDLFYDSAFLRVAIGSALCMMAAVLPYFILPFWALGLPRRRQDETTSPLLASCVISIIGGASMAGRLVAGFVSDLPNVNVLLLHNIALFFATLVTFMAHLINQYGTLCAYAAMFGFCYAFHMALASTILGETVGVERLTSAFGFVTIFRGLAPLCSIPLLPLLLGDASYCVSPHFRDACNSEKNKIPSLPANSMPRAHPSPDPTWWARVPPPPPTGATVVEANNGYGHVLWLASSLLLVACGLFVSLHFRPGLRNTSYTQPTSRDRSGSSRSNGTNGTRINNTTNDSSHSTPGSGV